MDDPAVDMGREDPAEGAAAGVYLRRSAERRDEVDALASALSVAGGGRVGLAGVLADLNRTATVVRVPARAARWGFRWDGEDTWSRRWYPQGITTSGDGSEGDEYDGRRVVMTSWYSKDLAGVHKGSRITVVDLGEGRRLRYRHVLLVDVRRGEDGAVDVHPLKVHAGGIVWHDGHLHVAGTARGIATFHLDDVMRVGDLGDRHRLSVGGGSFGYRYLLPVRITYDAFADDGHEPMRYSFLSLARCAQDVRLAAGEYGRGPMTRRLATYALDPSTSLLRESPEGTARPLSVCSSDVEGMQGATSVGDRWYVTTSAGRYLPGSLYVGRPDALRRRAWVLPVGVEDLAYWPSRDELWSLSEYPGRRYVFAMNRSDLD